MNATFATQRTGSGRAAVATVSVYGRQAIALVMSRFQPRNRGLKSLPLNRIHFGTWSWRTYSEELVVCRVDEREVEIHCHGGRWAAQSILESLAHGGAQLVSASDWLQRREPDRFVREALELLPQLTTSKAVAIALDQTRHAMRSALSTIRRQCICGHPKSAVQSLQQILDYGDWGTRLGTPFRIVVMGPPNTGKSSLMNALVGYDRAIVYDQPGTTRDVVTTETAIHGWAVTLADTAGIRATRDPLERAGIELATQTLLDADLVLAIKDLSFDQVSAIDSASITASSALACGRVLRVGTKCDLGGVSSDVDLHTSSMDGTGIDALCRRIIDELIPVVPEPGAAVPISQWQQRTLEAVLSRFERDSHAEAIQVLSDILATDIEG